jgi:hypothetical protein
MAKTIYVSCPHCEGLMEVNSETGQIVQKWAPGEKGADGENKIAAALKKMEEDKKRRVGLFDQTKDDLEAQKKKLENVFKKEVDRIKKEGIKENPIRPFDLD